MSGDPEDPCCFDGIEEANDRAEDPQNSLLGSTATSGRRTYPLAPGSCPCSRAHLPFFPPKNWRTELLTVEETPTRLQRKAVVWGYRANPYHKSVRESFASLCYVHNELVNIWTHVIATIVFVCLFIWHFSTAALPMDAGDKFFCAWFFLGTTTMLGFSASFHIVFAQSEVVHARMLACDLSGIVLAICGGTDVTLWLLFRCQPNARIAYLVVFNILCAALLPIATHPTLRHNQGLIVPSFTGVVVGSLVPLIHALAIRGGWPEPGSDARGLLTGVFGMLVTYGVGVVLYAGKLPESIWPGRFDFWGQSHQIWHTLIFLAPLFEYLGVLDGLGMKAKDPTCSAYRT